ncbi:MAG: YceI family protein [Raineya sp.]
MKKVLLTYFCVLSFCAFGQENLAVKSSTVTFKIKNFGSYVDGFFKGFEGKIYFSPQSLAQSSIEASVKTETINTGNKSRDNHLRKDDYFDVAKYPKITMKSKRFANSQSGDFIGYFDLTIKNKTQEVKLPFSYKTSGNVGTFKGSFTINRRDFGVGGNSMVLGDMVIVNIKIETFLK